MNRPSRKDAAETNHLILRDPEILPGGQSASWTIAAPSRLPVTVPAAALWTGGSRVAVECPVMR